MNHTLKSIPISNFTNFLIASTLFALLAGCGGSGGTTQSSGPNSGNLTLVASASTIASGGTATLNWTGTDVSSCVASNAWTGSRPISGTEVVGPMSADASYTLTCDSSGGPIAKTVTISISAGTSPAVSLTATPQSVAAGGSATLSWTSTNASSCAASGGWSGTKGLSGNEFVGPINQTTSFTLVCTDGSTNASSVTTVTVQPAGTPQLVYATYLGGTSNETIRDVAVGLDGSIYVAGGSESSNFPAQGGYDTTYNGVHDVIVSKFTPTGSLVWSTFVGGPNYDRAYAIEVDSSGDVYVAGRAGAGYPTTAGVVQQFFGGDIAPNPTYGPQDGFVTKLSTNGQLLWSTYLGGNDLAFIRDIDIDASGNVYFALSQVSSSGASVAHLITAGSFQTSHAGGTDGIVAKLSNNGTTIQWGTFLGGSNNDNTNPSVRLDQQGNVLVGGSTNSTDMPVRGNFGSTLAGQYDMHVTKFLPDGSDIVYAAYIGGSSDDLAETHTLAVDISGNAYVAAGTSSADFPVTSGVFRSTQSGGWDAYVIKLSPVGDLIASTFFGGSGNEGVQGISIGPNGGVFVSGPTDSVDLPVTSNALQPQFGGATDAYVAQLSDDLSALTYGTFVGGSTHDMARSSWVDGNTFYIVGHTNSSNFPVTSNAFDRTLNGSPNTGNKFSGDGALVQIEF